ncbi:MAG: DUF4432 family protein [Alphaproteobacteria bacterium]|nr:DUF4432 family protein [Alphaproteobacteria bacterium]
MKHGRLDLLKSVVGDLRQLASVRRIVLDDGAERGVRALSFSTGGGLDFLVLSDRSLDIGTLTWRGSQLAWQSAAGFMAPGFVNPNADMGRGFERGFSGFLITCGLSHIRQPVNGEPLHGRLPFTPARLTAYGEDWQHPEPRLFCEGEVVEIRGVASTLRLKRRIEAPIGGASIRIIDCVENLGSEPVPHALLYHFNLGFPGIVPGSAIELNGEELLGPITLPDAGGLAQPHCVPARSSRASSRAYCAVKSPEVDGKPGLTVGFAFDARTLGFLQIWRDLREHVGVLSIEPCTSAKPDHQEFTAVPDLNPGERRDYQVEISLTGNPGHLSFLKH